MTNNPSLTQEQKTIVSGLLIATAGVLIQIFSSVPYPKLPPVFFILLLPAGVVMFGRWRWTAIPAILAGLFLTMGLFSSGASSRLFDWQNPGGSVGLWIQMIGVLGATVAAVLSVFRFRGEK